MWRTDFEEQLVPHVLKCAMEQESWGRTGGRTGNTSSVSPAEQVQQPRLCRKAPWQPRRALCDILDEVQFIRQSFGCKKKSKKSTRVWGKNRTLMCSGQKMLCQRQGIQEQSSDSQSCSRRGGCDWGQGAASRVWASEVTCPDMNLVSPCPVAVPVWSLRVALRTGEDLVNKTIALFTFLLQCCLFVPNSSHLSWEDALLSLLLLGSPFWVYSCPRHIHFYIFQAESPFVPCHASVLARVPLYHHSFFLAGVSACPSLICLTFCILMKLFGKREGTLAEISWNTVPSSVAAPRELKQGLPWTNYIENLHHKYALYTNFLPVSSCWAQAQDKAMQKIYGLWLIF